MEKKKFNEYSNEEKQALLMHWWHYYGKEFALDEAEIFFEAVYKDSDLVKDAAVISYLSGESNGQMLSAMRCGHIEEYFESIKELMDTDEKRESYAGVEEVFIDEIVETYNNPEPDITAEDIIVANLVTSKRDENAVLTPKKVVKIFMDCMFRDEELKDGEPIKNFTVGMGVMWNAFFNTERLNEHKAEINEMLDEIKDIEKGPHFIELCWTKDGYLWTREPMVVDQLMSLGFATELLKDPLNLPREEWEMYPEGLPFVIKNNEKVDTVVVGNKPEAFQKIKNSSNN